RRRAVGGARGATSTAALLPPRRSNRSGLAARPDPARARRPPGGASRASPGRPPALPRPLQPPAVASLPRPRHVPLDLPLAAAAERLQQLLAEGVPGTHGAREPSTRSRGAGGAPPRDGTRDDPRPYGVPRQGQAGGVAPARRGRRARGS